MAVQKRFWAIRITQNRVRMGASVSGAVAGEKVKFLGRVLHYAFILRLIMKDV